MSFLKLTCLKQSVVNVLFVSFSYTRLFFLGGEKETSNFKI